MTDEFVKNAELLTAAIDALKECDQDYQADYLIGARPEIVSTFREALRLLSEERARRVEWQPIETAPKDGTAILIYHQRADAQAVAAPVIGGWFVPRGGPVKNPTHWMPLPEPPA